MEIDLSEKSVLNEFGDMLSKFATFINVLQTYPNINTTLKECLYNVMDAWSNMRPVDEHSRDSICAIYETIQYTLEISEFARKQSHGLNTQKICAIYNNYETRIRKNRDVITSTVVDYFPRLRNSSVIALIYSSTFYVIRDLLLKYCNSVFNLVSSITLLPSNII